MVVDYLTIALWAVAIALVLVAVGLFWLGLQVRYAAVYLRRTG